MYLYTYIFIYIYTYTYIYTYIRVFGSLLVLSPLPPSHYSDKAPILIVDGYFSPPWTLGPNFKAKTHYERPGPAPPWAWGDLNPSPLPDPSSMHHLSSLSVLCSQP